MKRILRKVLSKKLVAVLKRIIAKTEHIILKLFSLNPILSGIYYALFSRAFDKEHISVLKGRIEYARSHQRFDQPSSPMLRRNIHRIEKGLIMQPRRPVFAENYISETVAAFNAMNKSKSSDADELDWARHVLSCYFETVKHSTIIKKAFDEFNSGVKFESFQYVPYKDKDKARSNIDISQLETLFWQRRSTRWFKDKTVDSELLNEAIRLASLAPSACNRQPYEFYVSQNPEQAVSLCKLAVGTSGFVDNIPAAIAVVGDLCAYPQEKDRHLIYIDSSLASMQLMLALEVQGLSSCPLNWPEINWRETKIAKQLGLPPSKRVIMLIAVGHADEQGMIPYSQKKTVHNLKKSF